MYAGVKDCPTSAATEATFTTEPPSRTKGKRYLADKNTLVRFTSTTWCQSSSVVSSTGLIWAMPALLTITSKPASDTVRFTQFQVSSSPASPTTLVAPQPSPESSRDRLSKLVSSKSTSATLAAPSRANPSATSRPIPDPAPVTSAWRPVNRLMRFPPHGFERPPQASQRVARRRDRWLASLRPDPPLTDLLGRVRL